MSVERIRPASTTAWADLDDAKRWARVDGDFEDGDFARMIDAVALEAESFAEIALLSQTVRILLPKWPRGHVQLPIAPVLDPASVKIFVDTVQWTDFHLGIGPRPLLSICGSPPAGVIVIEYQAGFGSTPDAIPADLAQALLDQVAVYYDARGSGDGKRITLSPHFTRILSRYRGVRA